MSKLCALFVLAVASSAFAAVERYPAEPKPEAFANQEGCYLQSVNKVFPYDTRVNAEDGSCSQYLCTKSNGETQKFTCGAVAITPGCKAVEDLTQQYPDCCKKEQCDGTTPAPTTEAPSTTDASSTTPAPAASPAAAGVPGTSYAFASAKSEAGKPPVTQTYATPGAAASAAAT